VTRVVTPDPAASGAPKEGSRVETASGATRGGPLVFGILNVTPDSFSDGGAHDDVASAVAFALRLVHDGADVIDVGGESTRPGASAVTPEEEQRRVLPVVRELVSQGIVVSIDTMHASTAARSADLGATIVNDVTGGTDPAMAAVVASHDVRYIAMHSRVPGVGGTERAVYTDTVGEVCRELAARIARLVEQGVDPARIVVDPGLGFSKTGAHNWELLGGLGRLGELGHPVLVGASRKGFLGELLPAGAGMPARDAATAIISVLAAEAGAWGVRVHDVAGTRLALDVRAAWNGAGR
jgi:dihydropteroate synthase